MIEKRKNVMDRRSGKDRRKSHDLNYFLNGGVERRCMKERRAEEEPRAGWMRVSQWQSVFFGGILQESQVFNINAHEPHMAIHIHNRRK